MSSMDGKLQYDGKVYLYSSGMPDDLIMRSKLKLVEIGVSDEDILVITVPEGVPEGSIMVTIWPSLSINCKGEEGERGVNLRSSTFQYRSLMIMMDKRTYLGIDKRVEPSHIFL